MLVGIEPGQTPEAVRDALQARLPATRVVTAREFSRSIVMYLLAAQLGISFGTSTAFAVIVGSNELEAGTVVVRPLRAEPAGPDTASGQVAVPRTELTSHLTKAMS